MKKSEQFLKATKSKGATKTLKIAVDLQQHHNGELQAVDMGCGAGNDTNYSLSRGYIVFAFDSEPAAIDSIRDLENAKSGQSRFRSEVATFADVTLPSSDLVNAAFSLPFHGRKGVEELWAKIFRSIRPNGLFAVQLFGEEDSWKDRDDLFFVSSDELSKFCEGYKTEFYKEMKGPGKTAVGGSKYWHVHHFVLRKAIPDSVDT